MNAQNAHISLICPPISDVRYEKPHPIRSRCPIFRTLEKFFLFIYVGNIMIIGDDAREISEFQLYVQ